MIVKIQRPIMTVGEVPKALVYNESRTFERMMPMTPPIEALFNDGSLKVYHKAKVVGGELHISQRVEDRNW